jgi:hypothetical protein
MGNGNLPKEDLMALIMVMGELKGMQDPVTASLDWLDSIKSDEDDVKKEGV